MGPWGIKNYYGLEISEVDPLETYFDNTSILGDVLLTNFKIYRAKPSYVFLNPYQCKNLLARWDLWG